MTEEASNKVASERLRAARIKAGFRSAAEAARRHGWGAAAYRHHENGTRAFGIEQAIQYATAFKVSASWLLALVSKADSIRVPIARFYVQVYAENLGEGSEIYDLIDNIFSKLGLLMFPELQINEKDIEWIIGSNGLPPMHFIDPREFDVDSTRVLEGYIFAYRVQGRFPKSTLVSGSLLLIDSFVGEVERRPGLYLFRDEYGPFVRTAQRIPSGDTLLLPDSPGGIAESASSLDPIDVMGKVVWIGQRA